MYSSRAFPRKMLRNVAATMFCQPFRECVDDAYKKHTYISVKYGHVECTSVQKHIHVWSCEGPNKQTSLPSVPEPPTGATHRAAKMRRATPLRPRQDQFSAREQLCSMKTYEDTTGFV